MSSSWGYDRTPPVTWDEPQVRAFVEVEEGIFIDPNRLLGMIAEGTQTLLLLDGGHSVPVDIAPAEVLTRLSAGAGTVGT